LQITSLACFLINYQHPPLANDEKTGNTVGLMEDKATIKFESNNHVTLWGVTWMSFLWSLSSLMVFSVLPAFLVDELRIGHADIGIIEAFAIASSFASKFFSGVLSDVYKSRKPMIMVGTIMTALIKPLFALCNGPYMIFAIKFGDRFAKGIRSSPTDALIADLSEHNAYATNFGLRQSLYVGGEVVGSLLAMIIMLLSNNNYRLVFNLSLIPALMAVAVLLWRVKPNPASHPCTRTSSAYGRITLEKIQEFPMAFWWLMLAFFFLYLARFSEAFLSLKAKDVGWAIAYLPLLFIIDYLIQALVALPAGHYADRISRKLMLGIGIVLMIAAQIVLAYASSITGVVVGIILVGLHMGVTQGLIKALIAQITPPELRGTAFSSFFVVGGIAIFLANTIAGQLSQQYGLYAAFIAGSIFTLCSGLILVNAFLNTKELIKPILKPFINT
jgi:MFS family permease